LKEVSRIVVDEFGAIDNSMIMYDSLLLKHIIISDALNPLFVGGFLFCFYLSSSHL
jgi:hypothetical protein